MTRVWVFVLGAWIQGTRLPAQAAPRPALRPRQRHKAGISVCWRHLPWRAPLRLP